MADLIVTAPLVITKRADGSDVYLYEGASFPDGMAEGEADRLKALELLGEVGDEDEKKPARKTAASNK